MTQSDQERVSIEIERATSTYRDRDAVPSLQYAWTNPAYVLYMQRLERELLRALAKARVELAGASVLDIGCGSAYYLQRLVEYGAAAASGVDLMDNRIAEGRRRYPPLDLHVGSATQLPFAAESFDVVTQFTCLSSVLDQTVRTTIGAEVWRVLRPQGVVVSFDMAPVSPLLRSIGKLAQRVRRGPPGPITPVEPLPSEELLRLFPGELLVRRVPTLDFDLTQRLGGHAAMTSLFTLARPLRTHLLAVIRKP